jgi:hypothetical protein
LSIFYHQQEGVVNGGGRKKQSLGVARKEIGYHQNIMTILRNNCKYKRGFWLYNVKVSRSKLNESNGADRILWPAF